MQLFSQQRQHAADELGEDNGCKKGKAHHQIHHHGDLGIAKEHTVNKPDLGKAADGKGQTAENGNPGFLPQNFCGVAEADLIQRKAADHGDGKCEIWRQEGIISIAIQ